MKVLLIGSTGATGNELLPRLLAAGHTVTALVRNPDKVLSKNEHLNVIVGELRDPASVAQAVRGQDAVLVAFGPRDLKKSDLQETVMRNIVAGMQTHGVKRIVNLSAWGAGTTASNINPIFKLIRWTILRNVFNDKERGQKILTDSKLDYVNVSPARLINDPARGGVRASLDGKGLKPEMTRADLAQWMIEQLDSPTWVRKDPLIGY